MVKELDELIVALRPGINLHSHDPEDIDQEPQAAAEPT